MRPLPVSPSPASLASRRRGALRAPRGSLSGCLAAAVLAGLLGGCGVGDPQTVGRSGVDGLEVPTASPDPADFVRRIDNPWLPLTPGSRWRYRVVAGSEVVERVSRTVSDDGRTVAGVPVTVVREVVRDAQGRVVERSGASYAQDVAGNVWTFGEDTARGSWEAGVDGARAGLAMPASPRIGDGYEAEHAPGVARDRTRVIALDAEASVPAGTFNGLLETEQTTPLEPGDGARRYYARGEGLVREDRAPEDSGVVGAEVMELVAHTTSAAG